MKALPAPGSDCRQTCLAEELMIAGILNCFVTPDLRCISPEFPPGKQLNWIRRPKSCWPNLTASVTPLSPLSLRKIYNTDTESQSTPPAHRRRCSSLREAINDGSIDCIVRIISQHWDDKTCEFEYANRGPLAWKACLVLQGRIQGSEPVHGDMLIKARQILGYLSRYPGR